jgi:hypothetical protein
MHELPPVQSWGPVEVAPNPTLAPEAPKAGRGAPISRLLAGYEPANSCVYSRPSGTLSSAGADRITLAGSTVNRKTSWLNSNGLLSLATQPGGHEEFVLLPEIARGGSNNRAIADDDFASLPERLPDVVFADKVCSFFSHRGGTRLPRRRRRRR